MVDKSEGTIPVESLWQEKPLIEYFPELQALTARCGEKVDLTIGGENYQLSAHKYFDDGKWPHKDNYRVAFALWKSSGSLVACADYKVATKGWAFCDDRSSCIPGEIENGGYIGSSLYGFLVHENFRKRGVGDTLLAASLLVLEGAGVRGVNFKSDATRSDCADIKYWPQWYSDPQKPEVLKPTPMSSFYTKYGGEFEYKEDATVVSTRLSVMQLSLLENALGRYSTNVIK